MVAVITGSSKGIGKAIALALGNEGYDLIINGRNKEDLTSITQEISKLYPSIKVHSFTADLSKKKETYDFADYISSKYDRLDILVNNAGIFIPGNITEEKEGALESMMETNLYSAYHLTRNA